MCPMIKTIDIDVAVGSVTRPWQGSQYETLPFDAEVFIALLGDTGDTFNASVYSGSDILLQNSQIDTLAIATPITFPDDYSMQDGAAYGEKLGCEVTNLTGAVATFRSQVIIRPA